MTAHTHTEHVPGCYRCGLSTDEAKPHIVIDILRRHILPFCQDRNGDLPGEDCLFDELRSDRYFMEWTIDAGGARDWKVDQRQHDHRLSLRYRGNDPTARAAAAACSTELEAV